MALFLFVISLISYYIAFFLFGVGSVQGISAVIAPILSTSLYQVDRHLPFAIIAALAGEL